MNGPAVAPTGPSPFEARPAAEHLRVTGMDCGELSDRPRCGRAALRTVALHRVRIGRVDAHIDAALPAPLQRIAHLERHLAEADDLDIHALAVLQEAEPLMVGAAGDQ